MTSVLNERGDPVTLWSSGHGPVAFGIFRLEDGLTAEPDWTDDGVAHELPPGEPVRYPFQKSASWSPGDPDEAFMRAHAADPVLHLPPGHWRIEARLHGVLDHGELDHDGPQIMLSVTIEVVVTDWACHRRRRSQPSRRRRLRRSMKATVASPMRPIATATTRT